MKRKYIFSTWIFLTFMGAACGFCEENTTSALPAVAVHVQTVRETKDRPQVELVATVEPVLQAAVAAKVSGTITSLPVKLGSRVAKGDLLVKLSAEEISARVMQARAQLSQATRNFNREQKLLQKNASTPETVKSMQDMLAVAKAALQEAVAMLDYTTINAPFDGVVTRKLANSGDLATPGMPLLQMENDRDLQVVAAVPESVVTKIKQGDLLMVQVPSAGLRLSGTVAEIAPAADPRSRTTLTKINIRHEPSLRSGQFARVELPLDETATLFIPKSAVVPFGQMDKVFVLQDGRAELHLVRTGAAEGSKIEILAGLRPGDEIIIDNNTLLVSGQPVTAAR